MEDSLKPFALAVGELCNEWAKLEGWITRLFMEVGRWPWMDNQAAADMARCLPISSQIDAIKIGTVSRGFHRDTTEAIFDCLNYVDGALRNARNRFVHDQWTAAEWSIGAGRFENAPRIVRASSNEGRFIHPGRMAYVTLEEAQEIVSDVCAEAGYIKSLCGTVMWADNPEPELRPPPEEPPQRLHLRRLRERQSQIDKALAEQRRQPKS